MEELIIHAGTSKTGTSTFQKCLLRKRRWLRRKGVVFLPRRKGLHALPHHHDFAGSLMNDGQVAKSYIRSVLRQPQKRAIISSELIYLAVSGGNAYRAKDYWKQRLQYLDALSDATEGAKRTILLVFRRPDEFCESLYKTAIGQDATRMAFADFRDHIAPLVNYKRQTAAFRDRFEEVRTLDYAAIKGNLVPQIFRAMGSPVPPHREEHRNISPDARVILWLGEKNAEHPSPKIRRTLRKFTVSADAAALFAASASFWENEEARLEYCDRFGWSGGQIADAPYVAKLSDLDRNCIDEAFRLWSPR